MSSPDTRVSLILRLPDAADLAAWNEFVAVYAPLIFRIARRKGLQPADAEDLVQEVLAQVARRVSQWLERPERGPFRRWLFCIARNTSLNFITRRHRLVVAVGGDDGAKMMAEVADAEPLADELDREYREMVFLWAAEQVRQTVSEATWRAFWLTHVELRSIASVAAELQISVGNIYIARSRVMARLRTLVQRFEVLS